MNDTTFDYEPHYENWQRKQEVDVWSHTHVNIIKKCITISVRNNIVHCLFFQSLYYGLLKVKKWLIIDHPIIAYNYFLSLICRKEITRTSMRNNRFRYNTIQQEYLSDNPLINRNHISKISLNKISSPCHSSISRCHNSINRCLQINFLRKILTMSLFLIWLLKCLLLPPQRTYVINKNARL